MSISISTNRRILIIDDNAAIHEDYRKVLECDERSSEVDDLAAELFGDVNEAPKKGKISYSLDSALQGELGFQMLKAAIANGDPYAMAFVDMRMPPGWDGLETILHLWEADPQLNVVLCTAYSDYAWSDVVDQLGTNDRWLILKKPFDNAEVCQLAAALVEKRRLKDSLLQRMEALEVEIADRVADVKEREERLRAILDTAPDGIVTFDETGEIESLNTAASILTGINPEQAMGKSIVTLCSIQPDISNSILNRLLQVQSGSIGTLDLAMRRRDGTSFPSHWTIGEFHHGSGRSLTAIIRDESERESMRRELTQSQKLEAVGQLAAGIAHEINTPTQFVGDNIKFLEESFSGLTDVVQRLTDLLTTCESKNFEPDQTKTTRRLMESNDLQYLVEEIPKAIEQSLEGVARISKIVQAVKEFSHPGTSEKAPADIHESLMAAITVSQNAWRYVADIKTDFDPEIIHVPMLVAEMNQVFINLLVNSAHAIADVVEKCVNARGSITIRTLKRDHWVEIAFSDTGTGIPESIRDRIFDPFFTTKEVGKGTGQGLSISRSIVVDKHQGKIELESEVGRGTTIRLLLPLESKVQAANHSTQRKLLSACT